MAKYAIMSDNHKKSPLTLLVLAAGMGSRYGGIKQIDGFGPNGETIMDYSLYDAIRAGFTKIVFIVREEILETVKEKFLPKLEGKIAVEFVIQSLDILVPAEYLAPERTKPWGTGHAMLCAKDVIHEPFAVINADDFYGRSSFQSLADYFNNQDGKDHAMVGFTLKHVLSDYGSVSRGIGQTDASGFLTTVVEHTKIVRQGDTIISHTPEGDIVLNPEAPTSMNFWGFHPGIFPFSLNLFNEFLKSNHQNLKAEFFIPLIVNNLIESNAGKVKVLEGGKVWFGVTYPEDKASVIEKLNNLVKQGDYPENLWG